MSASKPVGGVPLSALVSQALVAFAVELDNEFEHQMPHRTTNHGSTAGSERTPWLVSMAMWAHCMRYVPEDGIAAGDLVRRTRIGAKATEMLVKRMSAWWGYLTVRPGPGGPRARSARASLVVRPTRAGRDAQRVWAPLPSEVERRWRSRLGSEAVDRLGGALNVVVGGLEVELPDYPPIGEHSRSWRLDPKVARPKVARPKDPPQPGEDPVGSEPPLWALLSKVLLALSLDAERGSDVALALSANVLRVLDDRGVRVRDLRALTGVAEMAVENSLSLLQKSGDVAVGTDPTGRRGKLVRLTPKGAEAQDAYRRRAVEVERVWEERLGREAVRAVRESLEALVGGGTPTDSALFEGLEPYPDGWRAQLPRPDVLPHYPMISHRGGFPDGS